MKAARVRERDSGAASRPLYRHLRAAIAVLTMCALIASALMLATDAYPTLAARLSHSRASAAPLILIGLAYLSLATFARAGFFEFIKRALLASAFILWGIDQLMTAGPLSKLIGDVVITLYVFDLSLMIRDHLRRPDSDV